MDSRYLDNLNWPRKLDVAFRIDVSTAGNSVSNSKWIKNRNKRFCALIWYIIIEYFIKSGICNSFFPFQSLQTQYSTINFGAMLFFLHLKLVFQLQMKEK